MTNEEFMDPVVVPGPNPRSLHVDTETVEEDVAEGVDDDDERICPTCHRAYPGFFVRCPDDGTVTVEPPPVSGQ